MTMRRNFERERDEATRRLMQHPEQWPAWPLLPLQRTTGSDPELGYLVDGEDYAAGNIKVYSGNIFMVKPDDPVVLTVHNADELLLAGWAVN